MNENIEIQETEKRKEEAVEIKTKAVAVSDTQKQDDDDFMYIPIEEKRKPGRPKGSKTKPKPFTFTLPVYDKKKIPKPKKITMQKNPGDDILFLMKVLALSQGVNQNSVDDMKARFHCYLQMCADENVKVGNLAAYMSFGVMNKQIADSWAKGKRGKEFKEFMLYVRGVCGAMREGMVQDGKLNPVVGIFWEKNHDGFVDAPKTDQSINDPLGDMETAEDIMKRYSDVPF